MLVTMTRMVLQKTRMREIKLSTRTAFKPINLTIQEVMLMNSKLSCSESTHSL